MLLLSFILLTPFRIFSLFSYPILIVILIKRYGIKVNFSFWILCLMGTFSYYLTFIFEYSDPFLYFLNFILSIYFIFFGLYLFFVSSASHGEKMKNDLSKFFRCSTVILFVINAMGSVQLIMFSNPDAFIGFYGRNGLSHHGLCIINLLFCVYWFNRNKVVSVILFIAGLLGFFGSALVVFLLAVSSTVLLKSKRFIVGIVSVVVIAGTVYYFTSNNDSTQIKYYRLCIESVFNQDLPTVGKVQSWKNYITSVSNGDLSLAFGHGPGKYNSRSSFFLEGGLTRIHTSSISSPIARRDIFTLWNPEISSTPFKDGTMNQPFGMWLALISEYGAVFTVLLCVLLMRKIKESSLQGGFVLLYTVGLFFIDNVLEYPEIIIFLGLFYLFYRLESVKQAINYACVD